MPRVLVVDDSAMDRRIVRGLLEQTAGFEVVEAEDGREALALIEENPPDIAVTDIAMPKMDGFAFVTAVKEDYPFLPVVLITGQGSEQTASKALQHGAASYVRKSRLAGDLLPTVQKILAARHGDGTYTRLMHYMTTVDVRFVLANDLNLIASTVSLLRQMLRSLPLGDEIERLRVSIALEESLLNALYHGSLQVSTLNPAPRREEYRAAAQRRMGEEPYRSRRIRVTASINRQRAEFVIRDEGPGFDHVQFTNAMSLNDQDQSATRGLSLMQSIMDEVAFNPAGNEVRLVKRAVSPPAGNSLDETAPMRIPIIEEQFPDAGSGK